MMILEVPFLPAFFLENENLIPRTAAWRASLSVVASVNQRTAGVVHFVVLRSECDRVGT